VNWLKSVSTLWVSPQCTCRRHGFGHGDLVEDDALKSNLQRHRSSRCWRFGSCRPSRRVIRLGIKVELRGLDVFDPTTMTTDHRDGSDVPAWFLDTNYNDLCFLVSQAFFPRTSAWENLRRALAGSYEDSFGSTLPVPPALHSWLVETGRSPSR